MPPHPTAPHATASDSFEARVSDRYSGMSEKLRAAADFVVANPLDVASRSLRSLSVESGVSPSTFSRLSKVLGFESYEDMRALSRDMMNAQVLSFSEKATRLKAQSHQFGSLLEHQAEACVSNINRLVQQVDPTKLQAAADMLSSARHVWLYGALGSTGLVEYMSYLARFFAPNWTLTGRMGSALAADLVALDSQDAMLIVTKTPYARRAVTAAQIARERGAQVILLTDHHRCPVLPFASLVFIVPSESPQFFSSYAATLVLIEALISQVLAGSPEGTTARIREVETRNDTLGEYWAET